MPRFQEEMNSILEGKSRFFWYYEKGPIFEVCQIFIIFVNVFLNVLIYGRNKSISKLI